MTGRSIWRVPLALSAACILAFLLLPSLIVVPIAFGNRDAIVFPPVDFGLAMFTAFFREPGWTAAAWLSARVATAAAALALVVGVPAAYGLARGRFAGRRLLALFLLSPMMAPAVVTALGLYLYFARIGLENGELRLILAHAVITLPFVVVTTMGGLQQTDANIEAAARLVGADGLTVFRRVTLPLIAPAAAAGGLFAFLLSFDEVVISWFVATPNSTTLPVKMFSSIQYDVSAVLAAISTMLTALSSLVCVAVALLQRTEPQR